MISSSASAGGTPAGASTAQRSTTSAGVSAMRSLAVAMPTVGVASSWRTSSSLTWVKSQNDSPTARNGVGMDAHTTSSTSPANSRHVDSGAAGTATTISAGDMSRSACTAANMLAPVASPSSTRMTVRPANSSGARPPR